MMRSMFSGVSGLRVHQTKMDVIANNISNVNTVAFKSSRVTFQEVFSQTTSGATAANAETGKGGVNPQQVGLGSAVGAIDKMMTTGAAQRTDRSLDVMIQGEGFFIVGDATSNYFTRAGNFDIDAEGNIHMNGYSVMGWNTVWNEDSLSYEVKSGQVEPLAIVGDLKLASPNETTTIVLDGNLNASEQKDTIRNGTLEFYDSLGNRYETSVEYEFTQDDTDEYIWEMRIGPEMWLSSDPDVTFQLNSEAGEGEQQIFQLNFDANGQYISTSLLTQDNPEGLVDMAVEGADTYTNPYFVINPDFANVVPGAVFGDATGTTGDNGLGDDAAQPAGGYIRFDVSAITQWGEDKSDISVFKYDGNEPGELTGYSIGTDGIVTGVYSNGSVRSLFQIPVAFFDNPAGLESLGGNLFAQTSNSGLFDGQGSTGSMQGGVLEMSNVDLSSEFTDMILTQRGFQANSKTITTSDELLQELINLKR